MVTMAFKSVILPSSAAETDDCTDGDIRLVGGGSENEGHVEVCSGMLWGSICDDGWDSREASVVCRQLGYSSEQEHAVVPGAFFGTYGTPIHLTQLSCVGNESRLVDCLHPPFGRHNCIHEEDAGVVCTGESKEN